MGYYEVHCSACGRVTTADKMSVDVDEMIREHLGRIIKRKSNDFYRQAYNLFEEIRVGLFFSKYDMVQAGILNGENRIIFTVEMVKKYIEEYYDVELKLSERKKADNSWGNLDDFFAKKDEPNRMPLSDDSAEQSGEVSLEVIENLSCKLAFYKEKDIDEMLRKRYVEELVLFLLNNPEKVLLDCVANFMIQQDDRGNEYIAGVNVIYSDGEEVPYTHMVCSCCGNKYFVDSGKHEEKIIVMLGSSRVGKTAYLCALLDEINPKYGQSKYSNLIIRDTTDARYMKFKQELLLRYQDGYKIKKTDMISGEVALFPLKIEINGRTIIIYFVDLPGEVFIPRDEKEITSGEASGKFIVNHRKICRYADAFWFCIDPVQIDMRLHSINDAIDNNDKVELDMGSVLSNIENLIHLMGNEKTQIPTAIMITKSDLIPREEKMYAEGTNESAKCMWNETQFRVDEYVGKARSVKRYLTSVHIKNIVPKIERIFQSLGYFSVAAYGRNVANSDESSMRMPYGISLPFLWTLTATGYIQPVKMEQKIERKGIFRRQQECVEYCDEAQITELFV